MEPTNTQIKDSYLTILQYKSSKFTEKKSNFIAEIWHVTKIDEINEILNQLRKKYYDANHVCYAYILENEREVFHFSDDGEPNGTAGVRIYNELISKNLKNVLLTVTRYFGGIKLGIGPLGKAYSAAAKLVLENSKMEEILITKQFSLHLNYDEYSKINKLITKYITKDMNISFGETIKWSFEVRLSKIDEFKNFISKFSTVKIF